LGLSFFLSSKIRELLVNNEFASWFNIMAIVPYFIIWMLFFAIFKISINKRIHTKSALISSFITALTWNIAKYGFISYVFYNQTYTTLYGSFSILIFFFLWIYISWIIFIHGLKLCYLVERTYSYKTSKNH
jgi:membrane protein